MSQVPEAEMPEILLIPDIVNVGNNSNISQPLEAETERNHMNRIDAIQDSTREKKQLSKNPISSNFKKYDYKEDLLISNSHNGKHQDFLLEVQRRPSLLQGLSFNKIDRQYKRFDATTSIPQNLDTSPKCMDDHSSQLVQLRASDKREEDKYTEQKNIVNLDNRLRKAPNKRKSSFMRMDITAEDRMTFKKMQSILNKLMPNNFEKLVVQVKNMTFKKLSTIEKISDLIYESAVDGNALCAIYAQLCNILAQKGPVGDKNAKIRFRNFIINKCQTEFEKSNEKILKREEREGEIAEEKNPRKKDELKLLLEFEETWLRKRSLGNIRFIGELYKVKMLTINLLMKIIISLMSNKDEKALECLCQLLTTTGKVLEIIAHNSSLVHGNLNTVFLTLNQLVDSRKTSNRVRFLLMDIIDLRNNNWIPRREI